MDEELLINFSKTVFEDFLPNLAFFPVSSHSCQTCIALCMLSFHLFCLYACVLSCFSHAQLFAILWTVARQAPLSMGFSRQEYGNGLSCTLPQALPDPGTEPLSHNSCISRQVSLPLALPGKPHSYYLL